MVKIPIKSIDAGIESCLYNAMNILESCEYISEHNMFHTGDLELVLYYYSLEEYGKAIKLKQDKEDATKTKIKIIDPSNWFFKHDKKIEAVRSRHENMLDITNKGILSITLGDVHVDHSKHNELLIKTFLDRSNFFLIGYDEEKDKWGPPITVKTSKTVSTKTKLLKREIRRFKRELFGESK